MNYNLSKHPYDRVHAAGRDGAMSEAKYEFGDLVHHPKYGLGVVTEVTSWENNEFPPSYHVKFKYNYPQGWFSDRDLTPHTPPPPEGTVPVRIAVALYSDGSMLLGNTADWIDPNDGYRWLAGERGVVRLGAPGFPSITFVNTYAYLPAAPAEVNATPEVSDEDR